MQLFSRVRSSLIGLKPARPGKNGLQRDPSRQVLVIMPYFLPDRAGSIAMHCDLWFSLADQGFEVTVRCPVAYYPEWRDKSGQNGLRIWSYKEQGVSVERFGLFIPSNPNSLIQRLLFETSMFLSMLRSLEGGRFDAVVAYSPNSACVAYAAVLKLLWRMPMWVHVLDVTADAAAATGLVKGRTVKRLLQSVEKFLYNRADAWSTISLQMAKRLSTIRSRRQPICLQPNWVEPSLKAAIEQLPDREPGKRSSPCRLLYVGNIGAKQSLLTFCEWLSESDLSFNFRIFGHGSKADEVRCWVAARNDSRFVMGESFLDDEAYARELARADVYAICEIGGSGAAYFPGKAVVAMQAGVPILSVCAEDSPLGMEVDGYDIGLRASWDDLTPVSQLIRDIRACRNDLERWGRNGRQRAEYYDRNVNIERFARRLGAFSSAKDISEMLEPEELALVQNSGTETCEGGPRSAPVRQIQAIERERVSGSS